MLHIAHRELERLVLDRDTLHFKQSVSVRYAQLIYDGLWFSTLREALAAFVDDTEKEVTGEVRMRLYKGRAEAVGRRSPRSLYRQDLATFGEGMAYDHKDAEGFIRLFGLPERVRALTRDRVPVDVKAVEVTRPVQRKRRIAWTRHRSPGLPGRGAWPPGIKPDRPRPAPCVAADRPCAAAGVFTTNLAQAAPVARLARAPRARAGPGRSSSTPAAPTPAPGEAGLADAREMAAHRGRGALGCAARGGRGGLDRRHRRAPADGQGPRRASPRRRGASLARRAATRPRGPS